MSWNQQLCSINTDKLTQTTPATRLHPSATQLETLNRLPVANHSSWKQKKYLFAFFSPMIVRFANVLFFLQELFVPLGKPVQPSVMREIVPNYSIIDAKPGHIKLWLLRSASFPTCYLLPGRGIEERNILNIIMVSKQYFQTTSLLLALVAQFSISFIFVVILLFKGFFFVEKTSQTFGSEHCILNYCSHDCGNFRATRKAAVTIDCRYSKTFASIWSNSV